MEWFWRREREKEEERKMAGDMPFLLKRYWTFSCSLFFIYLHLYRHNVKVADFANVRLMVTKRE